MSTKKVSDIWLLFENTKCSMDLSHLPQITYKKSNITTFFLNSLCIQMQAKRSAVTLNVVLAIEMNLPKCHSNFNERKFSHCETKDLFFDISQIRLICKIKKKNPTTDPAEEGKCVSGSALAKLNTVSFPFTVHIRILPDQNKALASSANIRFTPKPCRSIATTTRWREERALFSVFPQFVWQPRFHKLAS